MTLKLKTLINCFFFIFCFHTVFCQERLSLADAVERTLKNNPQLKQEAASITAAQAGIEKAQANYYPQLAANGSYSRIDPTGFSQFGSQQFTFIPADNYNLNLGIQFTVYDFGRTSEQVKLAKNGTKIAENSLLVTKQDLALATIQTVYQIHFLQEAIKVQDRQLNALNLALDQTKKLQQNGEATSYEVLTTQVQIASATNTQDDLKNNLNNAFIQLKRLTGNDEINEVSLVNNWLEVQDPASLTVNTTIGNRPEYLLAQLEQENAKLQEALARRNFNPVLSASIQAGYKNAIQPDINQLQPNYVAGAQLTIPLFNGFKNSAALKEAKAQMEAAVYNQENISETLDAQVAQAVQNLNNSYQKIARSQIQVTQASRAAELARLKYKNGVITNLDLLDAEIALSESEINQLKIIFNYTIYTYQLKKAVGIPLY